MITVPAILFYDVVVALHVMTVVIPFGVTPAFTSAGIAGSVR